MHYSKMRTARSSNRQLWGGGLPQCMLGYTPPQVWAWRPPWVWAWSPPGCWPGDPPWPDPSTSPGGGPGDPPPTRPLNFPPGCGTVNTGNKRAVHILLECILVFFCFGPPEFDSHYPRWTTTFKTYYITTFPIY